MLHPYTSRNYQFSKEGGVSGNDSASYRWGKAGTGGLNELSWMNGVRVHPDLSLGFGFSYLFGSMQEDLSIQLDEANGRFSSSTVTRSRYTWGGVKAQLGAVYRRTLAEKKYLNSGINLELGTKLQGDVVQYRGYTLGSRLQFPDTLPYTTTAKLPARVAGGLSYELPLKLVAHLDASYTDWSVTRGIEGQKDPMESSFRLGAGAEWIPDAASFNYFKRLPLRAGVFYERTPYRFRGYNVNDIGVSLGTSVLIPAPVRSRPPSTVDLAMVWGRMGSTKNGLIQENYFQIHLAATFSDRWFIRRKYD
ncbi:MAG: hypothetical protein HC842_04420 [Cytophagales bacterium]|nr:hypothetical protein [Cytophagales bacterium]